MTGMYSRKGYLYMKCVKQTDQKRKRAVKRGLLVISMSVLCAGCILVIKRSVHKTEREQNMMLPEEELYRVIVEYYEEYEDDIQRFIDISNESILGKEEYCVLFDRSWYYSDARRQYEEWGLITTLYSNKKLISEEHKEIERTINEDIDLIEAISSIKGKGIVTTVFQENLDESIRIINFKPDLTSIPVTPISSNDDLSSVFWCDTKECEKYGYENIEGNWYRYIGLSGDQLEAQMEKEYVEFEKLFRENEDDQQRFIELSQETALWEKEYVMNFSGSSSPRYQKKGWLTILYDNNMFVIEEDEELAKELNENANLKEALDSIKEKGVIIGINHINLAGTIQIEFEVDPTFTSFIKSNNGVVNTFSWCDNEECEKYGYKNIEGNWYMWISPAPE